MKTSFKGIDMAIPETLQPVVQTAKRLRNTNVALLALLKIADRLGDWKTVEEFKVTIAANKDEIEKIREKIKVRIA